MPFKPLRKNLTWHLNLSRRIIGYARYFKTFHDILNVSVSSGREEHHCPRHATIPTSDEILKSATILFCKVKEIIIIAGMNNQDVCD